MRRLCRGTKLHDIGVATGETRRTLERFLGHHGSE